ncbi:hypothetical protein ACCC96_02475 [Pseudomonas sp. Pseusp11]|jgi:hypothetical protein|uniref:hypothetical protein n=1 Tax=Pseudomonas sp. Pseusp11 TaxID=3243003 RepID=UPI0039B4D2C2
MADLEALHVKEAVDGVINLKDVPDKGATACIPTPDSYEPGIVHSVSVLISGVDVVDHVPVGEPVGDFFEFLISKLDLLNNTGPQKVFTYTFWDEVGNQHDSEPTVYDINHS